MFNVFKTRTTPSIRPKIRPLRKIITFVFIAILLSGSKFEPE
jgi:hypothetical protein